MAGANQRIYKIAGTGLGASMWFFLFYRAKKDGTKFLSQDDERSENTLRSSHPDTNRELYRSRPPRLEASMGTLNVLFFEPGHRWRDFESRRRNCINKMHGIDNTRETWEQRHQKAAWLSTSGRHHLYTGGPIRIEEITRK
ncbi:hypothetical protein QBC37DRAFT_409968 [Rhypophila decipiens]|uniref:Uncharacterized protein n=1 Tax=Rhypophila decipiens TaxID=261697 RepID=A0AAN6YJ49_9PEZI|nr:hypothetical protein QBC37DRAFT_409968 [Rhypophila decipiens]